MKHIVILCGGRSAEHEISFLSAASVLRQLDRRKYRISVIGIRRDGSMYPSEQTVALLKLEDAAPFEFPSGKDWVSLVAGLRPDVVFPVLHGPYGEDGTVQGVLEILNLPYVGAGVWGSAVGMNKIQCKKILRDSGLPVLPFIPVSSTEWQNSRERVLQNTEEQLHYPVFVKPANLGSSVGINKSRSREQLIHHVEIAFRYDEFILIEQGIEAREIEVSVLGDQKPEASLAGEVIPSREFYSYEAKYVDEDSKLLVPAPLAEEEMSRVRELALAAYQALQLEGMARMDFLMDKKTSRFWINEPNTIPGFTRISMYPKLWEASGLSYPELLDRLVDLGLERHRRRRQLSTEYRST